MWRKPNSCASFNHHLMFSFPSQSSIFHLEDESCHLLSVRYDVLEIKSTNTFYLLLCTHTHTHTHTHTLNGADYWDAFTVHVLLFSAEEIQKYKSVIALFFFRQ